MATVAVVALCGFQVVRKRDQCRGSPAEKQYAVNRRVGSVWYSGVDRLPWYDIIADYYAHTLPSEINEAYKAINDAKRDFTSFEICRDLNTAMMLRHYSDRNVSANEIIAIYSDLLAGVKGKFDWDASGLEFLGIDVVDISGWSLIFEGYFVKPDLFADWAHYINKDGLFPADVDVNAYVQAYKQAATQDQCIEPLCEQVYGIDGVSVYRVSER
jgi:hypothetical protein